MNDCAPGLGLIEKLRTTRNELLFGNTNAPVYCLQMHQSCWLQVALCGAGVLSFVCSSVFWLTIFTHALLFS